MGTVVSGTASWRWGERCSQRYHVLVKLHALGVGMLRDPDYLWCREYFNECSDSVTLPGMPERAGWKRGVRMYVDEWWCIESTAGKSYLLLWRVVLTLAPSWSTKKYTFEPQECSDIQNQMKMSGEADNEEQFLTLMASTNPRSLNFANAKKINK